VVGVALGVAVLFAGLSASAAMDAAADRTAADILGRADLRVTAFDEAGLSGATLEAIRATPGVASAAPGLERRTYLGPSATSSGLAPAVTVVGVDPGVETTLHDWPLAAGAALTAEDEPSALISERLAGDDRLGIGSTVSILGSGAPVSYRVIGILSGDGPPTGADSGGRTIVVPLRTAQAVFETPGLSRVDVGLQPGTDTATAVRAFESRLLAEPYVVTTRADLAASLRASTADVSATTALIAAVALFAGAFLIVNTLSMTVSERTREVGLLRAAGATRGQIRRFVFAGAIVIGLLGSALGVALGALLAILLVAVLGSVGGVRAVAPGLAVVPAAIAVAVGVLITLAAAIEPARRAARISPVEALRSGPSVASGRSTSSWWLVAVFLLVAVVGLIVWPGTSVAAEGAGATGAVRALGVYGLLLVVMLLLPVLVPALARIGGLPFRLPLRVEERLARSTLIRDRGRAALTLGPLTIGLALVVALGAVAGAARTAASDWVADVVPGDLLVTSIRPIGPDEGVAAELAAVPGVGRVSPIAAFRVAVGGSAVDAAAVVGSDLLADGRLRFVAGDRAAALTAIDRGGAAILPKALADRLGLRVGDTLAVTDAAGGARPLQVAGIAERTLPGTGGEAVLVGWPEATGHLGVAGADAFAVRLDPTASTEARASTLATLTATAEQAALEVVAVDHVTGAIDDALTRVFGLFDVLALVAVVVAALGIANTLTMNVVERVREIGILRATGMTRRQVWRSVVVEAGVVGVAGGLLGVVLGIGIGVLLSVFAGVPADAGVTVPWPTIAIAFVLGIALSMLAAAYPARLAARISIPAAVAYE
jgi:putative ABC transport system permease protein